MVSGIMQQDTPFTSFYLLNFRGINKYVAIMYLHLHILLSKVLANVFIPVTVFCRSLCGSR